MILEYIEIKRKDNDKNIDINIFIFVISRDVVNSVDLSHYYNQTDERIL
jgi:hypothetical protein